MPLKRGDSFYWGKNQSEITKSNLFNEMLLLTR